MYPGGAQLENWVQSLVLDFPDCNIPVLYGDDWISFADALAQEVDFEDSGIPGAGGFDDWQSWALTVFQTMANY